MREKNISTIQELAGIIQEGFQEASKDVRGLKFDIRDLHKDVKSIQADLIEHDKRADKMAEAIQGLYELKNLQHKVERIQDFLRKKYRVEV